MGVALIIVGVFVMVAVGVRVCVGCEVFVKVVVLDGTSVSGGIFVDTATVASLEHAAKTNKMINAIENKFTCFVILFMLISFDELKFLKIIIC
jgi:hypothetical protein